MGQWVKEASCYYSDSRMSRMGSLHGVTGTDGVLYTRVNDRPCLKPVWCQQIHDITDIAFIIEWNVHVYQYRSALCFKYGIAIVWLFPSETGHCIRNFIQHDFIWFMYTFWNANVMKRWYQILQAFFIDKYIDAAHKSLIVLTWGLGLSRRQSW